MSLAAHGVNGIENDIILFLRLRQLKWGATCYAIGTGVSGNWFWWHHQWHHSILYVKMINEVQHDFLVMCYHWHWHKQHVMLMALSMAQMHFLHQDEWNEVQHDLSGHVMPLALMLASHTAISMHCQRNWFIPDIKTIKMRSNMTFLSGATIATAIGITW